MSICADDRVARGDWLMLNFLSANRDEEIFDEPNRFRLDRSTVRATPSLGWESMPVLVSTSHGLKCVFFSRSCSSRLASD